MTPRSSVIGRVAVGIIAGVSATGCLDLSASCRNERLNDVASPDGRRQAVVFQRDCGATTGFSTQVSVLAPGATLPDSGGNVFSADSDHGRAPTGPGGGPEVALRWVSADTLEVRYDARARVFTREPHYGDTQIRFVVDSARAP